MWPVGGREKLRNGKGVENGGGGGSYVFENVRETWNSVEGRKGNVLSEAIQSNMARNKPVMCSFRGCPKIQGNGMATLLLLKSDKFGLKIKRKCTWPTDT